MRSIVALSKELDVSERTIRRWIKFWKHVHQKSKWWRKLSSVFSLNGKSVSDLLSLLIKNGKTIKDSFSYLIFNSAELWDEMTFSVGDGSPAKDA